MRRPVEVCSSRKGLWTSITSHRLLHTNGSLAVVMAASGVLLASSVSLNAQTHEQPADTQQLVSQARICDTSNQADAEKLSLSKSPKTASEESMSVLDERTLDSTKSVEPKEHLTLRELDQADPARPVQDPQCKPSAKENHSPRPADSLEQVDKDALGKLSKAPTVSELDGEITVDPGDASLRDVVKAIQLRTGIKVEYPNGNMEDRVFGVIGPASLRDVLTRLLYGSGLNYIIQTSAGDTSEIKKIVLSAQTPTASSQPLQASTHSPGEQKEANVLYGSSGFSDEDQVEVIHPAPVVPVVAPVTEVPGVPAGFNLKQAAADSHKTPAQLLDEMQKRQMEILDAQAPPPPQ